MQGIEQQQCKDEQMQLSHGLYSVCYVIARLFALFWFNLWRRGVCPEGRADLELPELGEYL